MQRRKNQGQEDGPTPICRCRVLYLGSAVPQVTKDGLQGIQEPLRELYPEGGAMGAKGIDSWLSVWSNGLLLENVDENHQRVTRFFPIDSLHYCAAVRYVLVPSTSPSAAGGGTGGGGGGSAAGSELGVGRMARFLPLDSPFARHPNIHHPPLFACIMRRTTGIKVLECHVFICKRETAANALVRCCFHAYADSTYAHHLEEEEQQGQQQGKNASKGTRPGTGRPSNGSAVVVSAESDTTLNSIEKVETWKLYQQQQQQQLSNGQSPKVAPEETAREGSTSSHGMGSASVSMLILDHGSAEEDNASSIVTGDQNHKIWLPSTGNSAGVPRRLAASGPVAPVADMYGGGNQATNTMRSVRSSTSSMMPNTLQTRSSRPRQILAPFAAPPPPPPLVQPTGLDEPDSKLLAKKMRKKRIGGRLGGSDVDDMSSVATGPINGGRRSSHSVFNFPIHRGGGGGGGGGHPGMPPPPGYPMSYPFFPGQRQPPPPPPHGAYLVPMPIPLPAHISTNGKKSKGLKFGTFSARGVGKKMKTKNLQHPPGSMMFLPPHHLGQTPGPPVMAPPPMALGLPVPMMAPPLSMRRGSMMTTSAEEPIYMPSQVRPLSPIASYAPAHFPHEAYLMQQHYTTLVPQPKGSQQTTLTKLKKKDKMKKKMQQQQQMQPLHPLQMDPAQLSAMDGMSLHGEEVSLNSQSGGGGIYRKGHLNERAFSYSIRQEHRSRSYSSLAGLGVGGGSSGGGAATYPSGPEDLRAHDKKERELIQMVHDLDLSGDDLERSEVPLAMYPHHHRQQPR